MGVERKAARKLRTQGGQSAASVNKSWAEHRLRCANAAHAAQPTAAARRPGLRSLAGVRQASGSARSRHAVRFYHLPFAICHLPLATCHLPLATCHLPLGSWLMAHGSWLMAHGSWLMPHAQLASGWRKKGKAGCLAGTVRMVRIHCNVRCSKRSSLRMGVNRCAGACGLWRVRHACIWVCNPLKQPAQLRWWAGD